MIEQFIQFFRMPFNAMVSDEYFLELIKYKLTLYCYDLNDADTRQSIEKEISELLKKEGCPVYSVLCDRTNNPPEVVSNRQIVVYVYFRTSILSKEESRYIIRLIQTWDRNAARHFNERDYLQSLLDLEFEVQKVDAFPN